MKNESITKFYHLFRKLYESQDCDLIEIRLGNEHFKEDDKFMVEPFLEVVVYKGEELYSMGIDIEDFVNWTEEKFEQELEIFSLQMQKHSVNLHHNFTVH